MAGKMVQCLKSRNTLRWSHPGPGTTVITKSRRQLGPEAFASSRETIYILANEGAGSAASPPTALAVAIAMAMEKGAERHCGRLALITLAELANVVRWASLPDQFAITAPRG